MDNETSQRDLITAYLLGELSEEKSDKIEERYFTDEDFFTEVLQVEEALILAYQEGTLPPAKSRKFETRYLRNPALHERWLVHASLHDLARQYRQPEKPIGSSTLAKPSIQTTGSPQVDSSLTAVKDNRLRRRRQDQAQSRPGLWIAAIAPLLIIALIPTILLFRTQNQRAQEQRQTADEKEKLNQTINDKQNEIATLQAEIDRNRMLQTGSATVATVILGGTRSSSGNPDQGNALQISSDTLLIKVRLILPLEPEDASTTYKILIATGGKTVLERSQLRPQKTSEGPGISYTFLPEGLAPGEYKITVKRMTPTAGDIDINSGVFYLK